MGCVVYNKEPLVFVNAMESYFKSSPPDCSLFSHDNYGILVHKELMYQTKFMREMIGSVGIDSKIDVFCPSLSKEELEIIVDFFYNGKIFHKNETVVSQVSKNLEELFGFPLIVPSTVLKEDPEQFILTKKAKKQSPFISASILHDVPKASDVKEIKKELKYEDDYITGMDPLSEPMSSDKELPNNEIGTNWNKNRKNCPNCQEVFDTTSEKLKHVAMMHPATKIYSCSHCDKKYINIRSLDNHEKKFHGLSTSKEKRAKRRVQRRRDRKKDSTCSDCGKIFSKDSELKKHIATKCSKVRTLSKTRCSICKEVFESKTEMLNHCTLKHPEAKIYHCSICDEQYRTLNGLNLHLFHVHERNVTDLGCSFCGKEFTSKQEVKNHILTDHKEKKYECSKCEASYRSEMSLQYHIESVHEGKKYQCTDCGEVFISLQRLESHTATKHDRTFECPTCKAVYSSKKALKEHIAFKHENSTGHLCPECGESFRYKRKLRDHILVVHEGNEYECQFCKKTFNAKSSMQTHIRTIHEGRKPEPSKCSLCDRYFTTKAQVKVHILAVHEKKRPYACDLCNLSFAQTAHLKTHMKGKHRSAI